MIVMDPAIHDALEHFRFFSIRELARLTCIPTIPVHRYLTQSLGFVVKHLRWVPHTLKSTQERERVTLSIELLRQLRYIEHHGWQYVITVNESWFDLSTDHERIWLRGEEQPSERPRQTIQDTKMMVAITWNRLEFHVLDALPKATTLNPDDFRVNILTELLALRSQVDGRRIVTHADSARPLTTPKWRAFCEENRLRLAVHLQHSPDLASSDFLLFGHIKHCLQGIAFPSCEELLAVVHEIVGAIPRPTLENKFRHWMERPEWISQNNNDYYP
jgi:hypothetical protein